MSVAASLQDFKAFLRSRGIADGRWSDRDLMAALRPVAGHVVIQDPSAANAEAGGRLPDHLPDSIQDFGKLLVREAVFDGAWHDQAADGKRLVRFGIAVGPPAAGAKAAPYRRKDKAGSFFADCDRDEAGHCKPGTGGKNPGKPKPDAKPAAKKPNNEGGEKPARASAASAGHAASPEEHAAAKELAAGKIKNVPVPPPEKVAKMRAALERAKTDPKARAGGDARGSAASRRARRRNLFREFGGDEKGYVVCHGTGQKLHWSADPKENPHGYDLLEQGKIFVARQGGGYQMPNLLPESFAYNRSRSDKLLRRENAGD